LSSAAAAPGLLRPAWHAPPGVQAAFTLRAGGASAAPFDALNLGSHVGDAPDAVAENRRRVAQALALPATPAWLKQVHGTHVADLDAGPPDSPADAAVTRRPGRVLAILVADCLPVLFASDDGQVLAAAHAGWRGLAGGVLEATLAAMAVPAGGIRAWLGPAIGAAHFEVGEEVRAAFLAGDPGAGLAFSANPRGRWQCDLAALARRRLAAAGVATVVVAGLCTHAHPAKCYSYRRDGRTGRMAALLWRT
jgi:YfiH family protein